MTYEEETYLLKSINKLRKEVNENNKLLKENNFMLKQIIKVINTHLFRHNKENEDDFNRNILANIISNGLGFEKLFKR